MTRPGIRIMPPDAGPILPLLFPPYVVAEEGPPERWSGDLHPEEEACVTLAVDKRRREFRAGRLCARAALLRLGIQDHPLRIGADRRPQWPAGVVGSISHADGYCGVAVARQSEVRGIGLDIEVVEDVPRELHRLILADQERVGLADQADPATWAALIFSAKEAVYKTLYDCGGQRLDFHDVQIDPQPETERFTVRLAGHWNENGLSRLPLVGSYRFFGPWVFTGLILRGSE